jgi:TRAP-type mannitol/chloroaromatic compound transport system substrate-binding protein
MYTTGFKSDSLQDFVNAVNAGSEGKLELTLRAAGTVVPATKEFDAVHDGILQFAEIYPPYWLDKLPNAGIFAYTVGGLSPIETFVWMTQGGGHEMLAKMIASYNVVPIEGKYYTPETFLWSNKPLKTLSDIKGMKFRTAGDDGEMFKAMGVAIVAMPGGEIYDAMKRGVIDAFQASSPAVDITLAVHEVSKYAYLSPVRQPTDYQMLGVNNKAWAALSPGLQKLVEYAYVASASYTYARALKADIAALDTLKKYGTIVEPASMEIINELIKQAQIFYDGRAAKDPAYAEILKSQRDFMKAYRDAFARL